MSSTQSRGACTACGDAVPTGKTVCPECGYDVRQHDRTRLVLGIVGTALTLSVVLAPLGLSMLWVAYRSRLRREGTVTGPAGTSLSEVSATVWSQHLGLPTRIPAERGVPGRRSTERNA